MARKKADFSVIKEQAAQAMENPVFTQIAKGTTATRKQTEATQEEAETRRNEGHTQGRKGASLDRMNMAFSPVNWEFIKVMSRGTGMSKTEFVNFVIEKYRKTHEEDYKDYKAFYEAIDANKKKLQDQD